MIGVLDRYTDNNKAVILIEEINHELIVPTQELPEGSKENTHFRIIQKDGTFKIISIDHEMTNHAAKKSSELMKKLRAKTTGSKWKRK